MGLWKGNLPIHQDGLQGFLHCLLGIEAKVFVESGRPRSALARARLLRALRSHSAGSVGSRYSGGIDFPPLSQGRANDRSHLIAEGVDVLGRHHDDINRDRDAKEAPVDLLGEASAMGTGLHHEEVQVAI